MKERRITKRLRAVRSEYQPCGDHMRWRIVDTILPGGEYHGDRDIGVVEWSGRHRRYAFIAYGQPLCAETLRTIACFLDARKTGKQ